MIFIITLQNEEGEKLIENRIDLNHVTVIFDEQNRRIKIEIHSKKCTKSIELYAPSEHESEPEMDEFNLWKTNIEHELKYSDPNQNKENGPYHVSPSVI